MACKHPCKINMYSKYLLILSYLKRTKIIDHKGLFLTMDIKIYLTQLPQNDVTTFLIAFITKELLVIYYSKISVNLDCTSMDFKLTVHPSINYLLLNLSSTIDTLSLAHSATQPSPEMYEKFFRRSSQVSGQITKKKFSSSNLQEILGMD